ncbi:InlB B-repeat-containing protein [Ruminococcus sp. OA3]|uniref:InlB B-repeat-containing protein n=1 Tax=Ruminococcus sp. OA3 TaxID=2914164 RepID=UPI001F067792|nr:InlB B-repeat-containing protein [Ruminococcus sp. OA3]MCH1982028.1 InlB B-repeat-containing protein [Ruminococcus sp. OA3]
MDKRKKRVKKCWISGIILVFLMVSGLVVSVSASVIRPFSQQEPVLELPENQIDQTEKPDNTGKSEEDVNGFIVYNYIRFFDGDEELTTLAESVLPGEDIVFPELPAKKSCRGTGWSLDENASRSEYEPGEKLNTADIPEDKEPVFYAVYEKTDCTLIYMNEGTGHEYETVEKGALHSMPVPPPKRGYRSMGWATEQGADSAEYRSGKSYMITEDMTLYPVWQKLYTISFRANNGKVTDRLNILTLTGIRGEKITLPKIPVYSGYTPVGWSIYSNSGVVSCKERSTYTITGNRVFYQVNARNIACPFIETVGPVADGVKYCSSAPEVSRSGES